MLVNNQMSPSLAVAAYNGQDLSDFNDLFHTELFSSSAAASSSASSSSNEGTLHALTCHGNIIYDPMGSTTPSFDFLDEDVKPLDPLAVLSSGAQYYLYGAFGATEGASTTDLMGIDPQLVGSPASAALPDFDSDATSSATAASSPEAITPVKVGGHGKARRGTVVGGGIRKASATPNKENNSALNAFMPSTTFKPRRPSKADDGEDEDDEDDPPPEVRQNMSSKEKRQLRNRISARNFRVRRKEYISTLEDNIAERDGLLAAIRAELGSTQSENLALRKEIAALKRSLLDNRGPAPVFPAPMLLAPFSPTVPPPTSLLASTSTDISPRPNPFKDVGAAGAFWGGASQPFGGGYMNVHTARIPVLGPFASNGEQRETVNAAAIGLGLGPKYTEGGLRPKYLASPALPYAALSSGSAKGLAALLAGKGAGSAAAREREREMAAYAVLVLRLAAACWTTFAASSAREAFSFSTATTSGRQRDAAGRTVLDGRAGVPVLGAAREVDGYRTSEALEEGMRCLCLGKR
ncbi:hypothetical protein DFH09DRAFT_1303322 [Mycena vulgaris]|nr:hypothetical protein DFH09DRAFT_1303322 [Mycena vulgaris]